MIRGDIVNIAGAADARPDIKADVVYSGVMFVPGEETPRETASVEVEDWRTVVDRGFMKGLTGAEIKQVFSNRGHEVTQEMNAYIDKYEGLIGPVFVDSRVIAQGFPVSSIPKKFEPYHRFAINCDDIALKTERHVEGGFSGELEMFLDAVANIEEKTVEVCRFTGLPVLRKGMFNEQVIDELLRMLGSKEHGQEALQRALKEKLLGIKPVEDAPKVESTDEARNVLKYNLREATQKAVLQAAPAPEMEIDTKPLPLKVEVMPEAPAAPDLKVDPNPLPMAVDFEDAAPDPLAVLFEKPSEEKDVEIVPSNEALDVSFPELSRTRDVAVAPSGEELEVAFYKPSGKPDIEFEQVPLPEMDNVVLKDGDLPVKIMDKEPEALDVAFYKPSEKKDVDIACPKDEAEVSFDNVLRF